MSKTALTVHVTTYCRSRFYSFGYVKPFLYCTNKEYHVSDDMFKVIISEKEEVSIANQNGYLLKGEYQLINYETFFRIAKVQPPSTDKDPPVTILATYPYIIPALNTNQMNP